MNAEVGAGEKAESERQKGNDERGMMNAEVGAGKRQKAKGRRQKGNDERGMMNAEVGAGEKAEGKRDTGKVRAD